MRRDPIVISPYDAAWVHAFEVERDQITPVLEPWLARDIAHVGSTSIPGMAAKAIIDMVAVVHSMDGFEAVVDPLRALGWVHAPEPDQAQPFRSFCTPDIAQRTHHLHVFEKTSDSWRDLLAFRDYLRAHPGFAAAYASLKRELASQHGSDPNRREPYRVGKATFIQEVTALASRSSSA